MKANSWSRGVARVISVKRDVITVACPHCPETHSHSFKSLGSKEVVAGCHVGGAVGLSYAIPKR